jgi:hypothetical protein
MVEALQGTTPEQFIQPPGIITATVVPAGPVGVVSQAANLVVSPYGASDIFAAGTVPVLGGTQTAGSYGLMPRPPPGTTFVTSTNPAVLNPCRGGYYRYTTQRQNGATVYDVVCQ